jgi:regulation of enolase protein 1 (concanavalin A-like superfamily)
VLTVEKSDWATGIYGDDPADFRIRATIAEGVLRLQVSADGLTWRLARLSPFARAQYYKVGPMCCTPERSGLKITFSGGRASVKQGATRLVLTTSVG